MTLYEEAFESMQETKPLASHIQKLGKIRVKTEDAKFIQAIDPVVAELQDTLFKMKVKSIPLRVINPKSSVAIKSLGEYCKKAIGIKQPEWQILAIRNGWTPPAKAV